MPTFELTRLQSFAPFVFRLWVAPPNERPLPEVYEDIYGGPLTIGNRGGIHVADTQEHIVLEAE